MIPLNRIIAPGKTYTGRHHIVHIEKKIHEPEKNEGDWTDVYLARDQHTGRPYTFKVVYDGSYPATLVLEQEAAFYEVMAGVPTRWPGPRFRETGVFNAKKPEEALNHPYRYLIKDYVPGQPLSKYQRLPFSTLLWAFHVSLQTLAEYEAVGYLHGDLKGKHVILNAGQRIPSWAISCALIDADGFRRPVGGVDTNRLIGGTGLYMPPEEQKTRAPGPYRDIYGVSKVFLEFFKNIPPGLRELRLVKKVLKLLQLAIDGDPSRRPSSIAQMAQEIDGLIRSDMMFQFTDFTVEIPQGIY
ncbi:MAG: hypothetical protein ABH823_01220 [bacterium]